MRSGRLCWLSHASTANATVRDRSVVCSAGSEHFATASRSPVSSRTKATASSRRLRITAVRFVAVRSGEFSGIGFQCFGRVAPAAVAAVGAAAGATDSDDCCAFAFSAKPFAGDDDDDDGGGGSGSGDEAPSPPATVAVVVNDGATDSDSDDIVAAVSVVSAAPPSPSAAATLTTTAAPSPSRSSPSDCLFSSAGNVAAVAAASVSDGGSCSERSDFDDHVRFSSGGTGLCSFGPPPPPPVVSIATGDGDCAARLCAAPWSRGNARISSDWTTSSRSAAVHARVADDAVDDEVGVCSPRSVSSSVGVVGDLAEAT
jgi:hypothetical protein